MALVVVAHLVGGAELGKQFVTGVTELATLRVNVGILPPMIVGSLGADTMMTRRERRRTNNCALCNVSGILFLWPFWPYLLLSFALN